MNDTPRMACNICRRVLNQYITADTGEVTYIHPLNATTDLPEHRPDPVPADQIDSHQICDFCSALGIVFSYQTQPVDAVVVGTGSHLVQHYGTDWAACIDCAPLIQDRDTDGLFDRCVNSGWPLDDTMATGLRLFQQAVLGRLLPGRTVATIGHWQPVALEAPSMPKIRDRLVSLLRGEDRLLPELDTSDVRQAVATGLDAARLFWIDPEFTEIIRHAAASLPTTHLTGEDAPAPHGLVAWAASGGAQGTIAATSWNCDDDGIRVVSYHSIGSGLAPASLQRLREQIGWLVPADTIEIRKDSTLEAQSPFSALAVTWLLIAQKLAETASADVPRSVRKAYARTGRPAPEVQLVRIRGASAPRDAGGNRHNTDDAAAPSREYRWWVRGFWRNQPYGPGRTYRRPQYISPHLRGPEDKPIRASTTVRILGSSREPTEESAEQ